MELMIFARIFLLYCPEAKTTLIKKKPIEYWRQNNCAIANIPITIATAKHSLITEALLSRRVLPMQRINNSANLSITVLCQMYGHTR